MVVTPNLPTRDAGPQAYHFRFSARSGSDDGELNGENGSARHRLLVINLYLEAQVLNHAPDFRGWLARCR